MFSKKNYIDLKDVVQLVERNKIMFVDLRQNIEKELKSVNCEDELYK